MEVNKTEAGIIILLGLLLSAFVVSYVDFGQQEQKPIPEFSDVVVDDSYDSDIISVYDDEGEMVCYFLRSDNSVEPIDCFPVEQTNYTESDFRNR